MTHTSIGFPCPSCSTDYARTLTPKEQRADPLARRYECICGHWFHTVEAPPQPANLGEYCIWDIRRETWITRDSGEPFTADYETIMKTIEIMAHSGARTQDFQPRAIPKL
jgi:hypothetical protein